MMSMSSSIHSCLTGEDVTSNMLETDRLSGLARSKELISDWHTMDPDLRHESLQGVGTEMEAQ